MAKRPVPMHVPPPMERHYFEFQIPPSQHPTTVRIEARVYQGPGSALIEMRTLRGDGLVAPDKFCYAGKEHPLAPLQWKLLRLLLDADEKRVGEQVVMAMLWTDGSGDKVKLKKVCADLRRRLNDIGFPPTSSQKDGSVVLEYP